MSETRWEDGKLIVLGGEIYSNVSVGDALNEFRVVTAPMLATLDVAPALLKWQEGIPGVAAVPDGNMYSATVMVDAPALYWRLGESAGSTAADASGNSRTGTYTSVQLAQTGALNGDTNTAIRIDVLADSIAKIDSTYAGWASGRTWEAWVYKENTSISFNRTIFAGTGANPPLLTTLAGSSPLTIRYDADTSVGGGTADWTSALVTDGWHHIALTHSGTTAELYVDGISKGTRTVEVFGATPGNFRLGANAALGFQFIDGRFDEVAIYTSVLSAARILAHYQANAIVPGSPAVIGGLALQRLVKLDGDVSPTLQEAAAIVNYQAQFFAEDPRAYSQTLTTVNGAPLVTSAAGAIFPVPFNVTFGAATGGTAVCTNAGNRPTPPIFRILGGCGNPTITRLSNGAKLSISGTIGTGDYLELDVAKRTVKLNGSSNATNMLDSPNSDWASMEVPAGTETYTMRAATNDSSAALTVFFRAAYA